MSLFNNLRPDSSNALGVLCKKKDRHYIFEETAIIGRSPTAFLCLTERCISRKHCVIEKTKCGKFTICDLSNSGTCVNDERLLKNKVQELHNLDRIKLANKDEFSYVFVINKKLLCKETHQRIKNGSPLSEKMMNLNESQSLEKESMDRELNLVESEVFRLKEELQEKLKAREDELEREKLKISLESAYNKELAEKAEIKLKETMEEKEKVKKGYELKIADVSKKEKELQQIKIEMEKRHQIERDELESKCKAEIENLNEKLKESELKRQEFEELKSKLKEVKEVLLVCEIEQQRLFEAKVEVENELGSKILDLTNERKNKTEQLKELQMKLKEKEKLEEKVKREIDGLEDDMMCSICAEFYIEPTALNCGHMFCKLCITEWNKKKKICPMCRAKISSTIRIFNMDSVIQRNIRLMSEEAQSRREAVISERMKGVTPQKKSASKRRRLNPPNLQQPSSNPRNLQEIIPNQMHAENHRVAAHHALVHEIRPFVVPEVQVHRESEGVDPFAVGWVPNQHMRNVGLYGRNSPVTIAAVDLTNVSVIEVPQGRVRSHTVTSAEANTTIDLTNI